MGEETFRAAAMHDHFQFFVQFPYQAIVVGFGKNKAGQRCNLLLYTRCGQGYQYFYFVDDDAVAAECARKRYRGRGQQLLQLFLQVVAGTGYLRVQEPVAVRQVKFYILANVFLCFGAEAFQEHQAVFVTGIQELAHRFYFQLFPDGGYFFGSQALYFHDFKNAGRRNLEVMIKQGKLLRVQHFKNAFTGRFPDAFNAEYVVPAGFF